MPLKTLISGLSGGLFAAALASNASAADQIDRLCGPPGLRLGMSVQAWKALAFPGDHSGQAQPVCSDDPGAASFLGVKTAAAPGAPLVCGYASRIGSIFLRNTITMLGGYSAQGLRYSFPAGRLTEIDCTTSDDAFDAAQARFDKLYGQPKSVTRDSVRTEIGWRPRVRESWSIPGGSVTLTDPVQPATNLKLRYRLDGAS